MPLEGVLYFVWTAFTPKAPELKSSSFCTLRQVYQTWAEGKWGSVGRKHMPVGLYQLSCFWNVCKLNCTGSVQLQRGQKSKFPKKYTAWGMHSTMWPCYCKPKYYMPAVERVSGVRNQFPDSPIYSFMNLKKKEKAIHNLLGHYADLQHSWHSGRVLETYW